MTSADATLDERGGADERLSGKVNGLEEGKI